jgi:hypothetical protein
LTDRRRRSDDESETQAKEDFIMADWAKQLGERVLASEHQVNELWRLITSTTAEAIHELDEVLQDKSQLKLTLESPSEDHFTVKSDRGIFVTLKIDRVTRRINVSGSAGPGVFYVNHEGKLQLISTQSNNGLFFGVGMNTGVPAEQLVKSVVTYVVNIA